MLEGKVPTPKFVAPEELRVLQTCLQRWRTEVEADVKGKCTLSNTTSHSALNR